MRCLLLRCSSIILSLALAACEGTPTVAPDAADAGPPDSAPADLPPADLPGQPALYLQVDEGLPAWVGPRLRQLLAAATDLEVKDLLPASPVDSLPGGSLVFAVGQTTALTLLDPGGQAAAQLQPEGYLVRSAVRQGVTFVVATGRGDPTLHGITVNRGALYGAYAALEALGFGFLHPLEPVVPSQLRLPAQDLALGGAPRWPERGLHLHTMHPLELTELLNGWGETGTADKAGFSKMLAEWRLFCEWMLANRQNTVEWVLLWATEWASFADSTERQQRLQQLVQIAHEHGLAAGVDVGIALEQQHTFRLVRSTGDLADEKAQIRQRADYLMAAGFDFISTEIGTSEFTSPDDKRMLAWIDELSAHLVAQHGAEVHIKIHCSTGQTAPNYLDPRTGQPINYNFLPHFAVPEVGVLPHTVQLYALDDPAPTYGNTDFVYMREFLRWQAGKRRVLWHPETAYWVSYDIDVPLFLPLYAERRLHDLRLIAADEDAGLTGEGAPIQGQMIFSSGWEWGYWLNDVIAARAAYDPLPAALSEAQAARQALQQALGAFGPAAPAMAQVLATVARDQHELLVLGRVDGKAPSSVVKRNGQAYMQGWEAFDDVGNLVSSLPSLPRIQTQPDKLGLVDMRNPLHGGPGYQAELRPLLARMASTFDGHHAKLLALKGQVPADAEGLFQELLDGARITALRARQLLGLYDYVDGLDLLGTPSAAAKQALADARAARQAAQQVVAAREQRYRVPLQRIAGWRDNPTAYRFGYLWTVHTLHYWWRDEGKAVKAPVSPCYLNIMDPAKIAFGEGFWVDAVPWIKSALNAVGLGALLGDCLAAPTTEPSYPPSGL